MLSRGFVAEAVRLPASFRSGSREASPARPTIHRPNPSPPQTRSPWEASRLPLPRPRDDLPSRRCSGLLEQNQVLAGQILLLFGFAEIMRSRRVQMTEGEPKRPSPAGD